jgi:hypothetical protein
VTTSAFAGIVVANVVTPRSSSIGCPSFMRISP